MVTSARPAHTEDFVFKQLSGYTQPKSISFRLLLILALLGAVGFAALRYLPTLSSATGDNPAGVSGRGDQPSAETEDLLRHLDSVNVAQKDAFAAIERSRYWTDRTLSSLDDPALTARRLE